MGSIEVYDTKLAKWVPYVPDYKKWEQHFKDISEGRVRPDHKGRYIVGSGSRNKVSPKQPEQPKLTLVTPVAQAVEIAKSELRREEKVIRERKRKATSPGGPSNKKLKALGKKNGFWY
ncbi:hypothetical protein FSP39_001604 [Pinctada imbricata]|uniref:Uncharacterized protein n=1 Tax=Pinctada imbricata TaxID=66713 RepID=A0AA88XIZ9_PINIB|nr:hypothetical protein FSP39_001604 [Pinctada imbricata]